MISVEFPLRLGGRLRHVWLASKPDLRLAPAFAVYFNCGSTRTCPGFFRQTKRKLEVDISRGPDSVLARMGQDARYKVRRAMREGAQLQTETDMSGFLAFYNGFAAAKALPLMAESHLKAYWPHLVVSTMWIEGERASSHAWMVSSKQKKASLLWAASRFRQCETSVDRNRLSRVHLLHYLEDMTNAAKAGCTAYDFGYFGQVSREMEAVNRFKSQFPCTLSEVSTYTSIPYYVWTKLRRRTPSQ
jgi:hypothetical protein